MLVTINGFEPPQHLSDAAFPLNAKLSIYKRAGGILLPQIVH